MVIADDEAAAAGRLTSGGCWSARARSTSTWCRASIAQDPHGRRDLPARAALSGADAQTLSAMLGRIPGNAEEIVWVQEEPENMGAWDFIRPHLIEARGQQSGAPRRAAAQREPGRGVGRAPRDQPADPRRQGLRRRAGDRHAEREEGEAGRGAHQREGMSARTASGKWGRWKSVGLQALCSIRGSDRAVEFVAVA